MKPLVEDKTGAVFGRMVEKDDPGMGLCSDKIRLKRIGVRGAVGIPEANLNAEEKRVDGQEQQPKRDTISDA